MPYLKVRFLIFFFPPKLKYENHMLILLKKIRGKLKRENTRKKKRNKKKHKK